MQNRRTMLGLGLAAAVGIGIYATFGAQDAGAGYEVRALTAAEMMAGQGLVVDIRTAEEWAATGVLEGATLQTFADAESFLATVGPGLADGRDLILICQSGRRSGAAAKALAGLIPNKVISVEGGMGRVLAEGYSPVPPG